MPHTQFKKDGNIISIIEYQHYDGALELQLMVDIGEIIFERISRIKENYTLLIVECVIKNL